METNTNVVLWKTDFERLQDWYRALGELKNGILKNGTDYYYGKNSGKPVLLKPGAEKIARLFGFHLEVLECIKEITDESNNYLDYTYRCVITDREGKRIGICEGSANSREDQFRYSYLRRDKIPSDEVIKEMRKENRGFWKRIDSRWVWVEKVENQNIFNLKNRIQKMAQKRAFVGAVLIAAGASEFFTQDKSNG
jgi:hypothetical protein